MADDSKMLQLMFGITLGQAAILTLLMSEGLISNGRAVVHIEGVIEGLRAEGATTELRMLDILLKQVRGITPPPLDT